MTGAERPAGQPTLVDRDAPGLARSTPWRPTLAALLAVVLVALVYSLVFPNLWYGEHDISDIGIYQYYAQQMADGGMPYRDFPFEYPPIAAWLIAFPGDSESLAAYTGWSSLMAFLITAVTGALVALTAARIWPRGAHAFAAAVLFAGGVAAVGAIVENRLDIAVACVLTAAMLALAHRWLAMAAAILGLGFALKLFPAVFLPLVLLLCPTWRRALWATASFALAAVAPFLPYLLSSPQGVWQVFTYHLERPLQIESVLAAPLLLARTWELSWVDVITSYGSQGLQGTGTVAAATLSSVLTAAAVATVYALLLRHRQLLLASPRLLPLAGLALILALLAFAKVLSPQFFVWLLPMVALAALEEPLLAALAYGVLLLTQINFPAKYWGLVYVEPSAVYWLAARDLLLVLTFLAALWRLVRQPEYDRCSAPLTNVGEPRGRLTS